ncbi:MAG TPA: FAD-dependent oxidoreductase [Herpetosiphonaceae bacterium]|nr:FAD-dependent oxidoreductase [Herpetosiphonaceae bacterium]
MIAAAYTQKRVSEVVVVGGGPAGSATAAHLARAGHDVVLYERGHLPRHKPCAEYCSPGIRELLARLGALDVVTNVGARAVPGMRVFTPSGRSFLVEYTGAAGRQHALTMRRYDLDKALLDHAAAAGVQVVQHASVRGLVREGGRIAGVEVSVRGDTPIEHRASLTVGADGINSVVAREVGARRRACWPRAIGLVAHYAEVPGLRDYGEMHVGRTGYVGVAPLPNGLANVAAVVPLRSRIPGGAAGWTQVLGEFPVLRDRLERARQCGTIRGVGPVGARARRASGDGWALVGDAAGYFDPFTGEGIYKALLGAALLAEAAHGALGRGDTSALALRPYERHRRRQMAGKALLAALVQVFVAVPALLGYAAPRLAAREAIRLELGRALGDYGSPWSVLHPAYLLRLLRP